MTNDKPSGWAEKALEKLAQKRVSEVEAQNRETLLQHMVYREASNTWNELKAVLRSETTKFNGAHPGTFVCQEPGSAVDTVAFSISTTYGHLALTLHLAGERYLDVKFFGRQRENIETPTHASQYELVLDGNHQISFLRRGSDQYSSTTELASKLLDLAFPIS